jgi:hypothetical protein
MCDLKKNSVWNLSTTTLHDIFYSSLERGSSVVIYNLEIDALTIYFDPRSKIIFSAILNVQKLNRDKEKSRMAFASICLNEIKFLPIFELILF